MELPSLFDADLNLCFAIVEPKEAEEDASLWLMGLALDTEPVGIGFSLAHLTGTLVQHPAALVSLGVPTDALVRSLQRAWRVRAGAAPTKVSPPRAVSGSATTVSREVYSTRGLAFTLKDLRWEKAGFTFRCSGTTSPGATRSSARKFAQVGVVLEPGASRLHLSVPPGDRSNLVRMLSGELHPTK